MAMGMLHSEGLKDQTEFKGSKIGRKIAMMNGHSERGLSFNPDWADMTFGRAELHTS